MPTQVEREGFLQDEVDRLRAENERYVKQVGDLTTDRDAALDHSKRVASERDQLQGRLAAIAERDVPSNEPNPDERSPDTPRWLYKHDGGVDAHAFLCENQAAHDALQQGEPDTWFESDVDAFDAFHRREAAKSAGQSVDAPAAPVTSSPDVTEAPAKRPYRKRATK